MTFWSFNPCFPPKIPRFFLKFFPKYPCLPPLSVSIFLSNSSSIIRLHRSIMASSSLSPCLSPKGGTVSRRRFDFIPQPSPVSQPEWGRITLICGDGRGAVISLSARANCHILLYLCPSFYNFPGKTFKMGYCSLWRLF